MTSLTLVRRIKARPSIVFDALTTPEGIASWWGPTTARCCWPRPTRASAAASGCASACSTAPSTRAAANISRSTGRAAGMSWRWAGGEDPGESLVEIELRAIAEGTELTFTHSRLHDEDTRRSHEEGWNGALDKLERHFLVLSEGSHRDHA